MNSSSASLSVVVVVYPLRHTLCSLSQPQRTNEVPSERSTEPQQSYEHVTWRQSSAVGDAVGRADREVDGTVGLTDGAFVS